MVEKWTRSKLKLGVPHLRAKGGGNSKERRGGTFPLPDQSDLERPTKTMGSQRQQSGNLKIKDGETTEEKRTLFEKEFRSFKSRLRMNFPIVEKVGIHDPRII